MRLENKQVLGFFQGETFDLQAYLTYLFKKLNGLLKWKNRS